MEEHKAHWMESKRGTSKKRIKFQGGYRPVKEVAFLLRKEWVSLQQFENNICCGVETVHM
jgi:hypothetical protein